MDFYDLTRTDINTFGYSDVEVVKIRRIYDYFMGDVDEYDIVADSGSLTAANYAFAFKKGKLTILPKDLDVVAADQSKVYGDSLPIFTAIYNGFVKNGDSTLSDVQGEPVFETDADQYSDVADYYIEPKRGGLQSRNYALQFRRGKLVVNKRPITLAVDSASKIFGELNPSFSVTLNGLVKRNGIDLNDLTGTPDYTTDAGQFSDVGDYEVVASKGQLNSRNYSFGFAKGKLSIRQRELTVQADNKEKILIFLSMFDFRYLLF